MKTIILNGLRRSGNHFLLSSIIQQFSNYVHMNDVTISYDKYIEYKSIKKDRERIDTTWSGFKDVECVIISSENKNINDSELNKFKKIDDCYIIVLLRSPYTHFSSVWKEYNKNKHLLCVIINLWKQYANYFINNSDYDYITVLYDEFTINDEYRLNIIKQLGINTNVSVDVNKYIKYQRSSFSENNKQQVYKNLNECIFKDDENFLNIVKDEEIENLWNLVKTFVLTRKSNFR